MDFASLPKTCILRSTHGFSWQTHTYKACDYLQNMWITWNTIWSSVATANLGKQLENFAKQEGAKTQYNGILPWEPRTMRRFMLILLYLNNLLTNCLLCTFLAWPQNYASIRRCLSEIQQAVQTFLFCYYRRIDRVMDSMLLVIYGRLDARDGIQKTIPMGPTNTWLTSWKSMCYELPTLWAGHEKSRSYCDSSPAYVSHRTYR